MSKGNEAENIYQKHITNEKNNRISGILASCYADPNNIDNWRHERMRNIILPLIEFFPASKWMTVGDGSYGSDAYYLQKKGLDVLATSISDETLSEANKLGYIHKFKAVNAEQITENDNSFEFVFCKEAYHHFPRPPIALYEMLRVAKNAVILIEPQENNNKLLDILKKYVKIILRKNANLYYEDSGNYIYRINIKEKIKMMTALNFRFVAYKNFNDFFFSPLSSKSSKGYSWAKILTNIGIGVQNLFCKLYLLNYGLVVVLLFKNDVNENLVNSLNKSGYTIKKLPRNPYIE